MYKIIGADGKQYGPVSAAQLLGWYREGRVNGQTLVCAEGSLDWKPFSAFPELTAGIGGAATLSPNIGTASAGAGIPLATDLHDSLPVDYDLDIGGCISASWELVKNDFATVGGATAVLMLIQGAISLLGCIPLIGAVFGIVSIVVTGPLLAGSYAFFLRAIRKQPHQIENIFDGFKVNMGQNILAYLVYKLLTIATMLPGLILIAAPFLNFLPGGSHSISPVGLLMVFAGLVIAIVPAVYCSVSWIFTLPLVIDKGLGFWDAMKVSRAQVGKHFWAVFGLAIVSGLLNVLGFVLCCVGLFVTMPMTFGSMMYGYETLFRKTAPYPQGQIRGA
jgi:hypothetical protein